MTTLKPGQKAPRSGQYEIIGPRGGRTGIERTVTKGEPFPPTPKLGGQYRLVAPIREGRAKAETMRVIDETSARYSTVLKRLAER